MGVCRREFTTAGVAAGVSAGFHAPIGGLLFAMEDLSSFWTKTLSWQTFFCCVIAGVASQVFNIAFAGFDFQGQFGAFNVQVGPPVFSAATDIGGGSVAEWLACWTQAQKGLGSNRSRDAVG